MVKPLLINEMMKNIGERVKSKFIRIVSTQATVDLAIFLITGLFLTIVWLRNGLPVLSGELGFIFHNSERLLHGALDVWVENRSTGFGYALELTTIPFHSLMSIFDFLHIPVVAKQGIVFFFMLSGSGIAMYYLTRLLIRGRTQRLAAITAGLFYVLNPYMLRQVWGRWTTAIFYPILPPLLLIIYIRALEGKNIRLSLVIMNILFLLFTIAFANPAYLVITWLILFAVFIMYVIQNIGNRSQLRHIILFSFALFSSWFLLNSWWLIPTLSDISHNIAGAASVGGSVESFLASSERTPLYLIFGLADTATLSWIPEYTTLPFTIISFATIILVFSALVFRPMNRFTIYFALLALAGVFLSTGSQAPFGESKVWLMEHLSWMIAFRDAFGKFGVIIALSYAFLFGVGVSSIYYLIRGDSTDGDDQ